MHNIRKQPVTVTIALTLLSTGIAARRVPDAGSLRFNATGG